MLGIADQGPAKRYPLAHAAGELSRPFVDGILKMHEANELHGAGQIGRAIPAHHLDREQDVLQRRLPGQQGRILKHNPDFRARLGHQDAVGEDAAVAHHFKTGDHHQERALAATARAEQADELALLDGEGSRCHRLGRGRSLSEHLAYVLAADLRLLHATAECFIQ